MKMLRFSLGVQGVDMMVQLMLAGLKTKQIEHVQRRD